MNFNNNQFQQDQQIQQSQQWQNSNNNFQPVQQQNQQFVQQDQAIDCSKFIGFFGIMIPGLPLINQFQFTNNLFYIDLQNPSIHQSIGFFLINSLPENLAAALYFSSPPYENLEFIGAIANARPSDIFSTGFSLKPQVNVHKEIKLVVKIEPLQNLKTLVECSQQNDLKKDYAKLVAQNLFNFMISFHKEGLLGEQYNDYLLIPNNFLEKWLQKFEMKYKFDPNLIYKTDKV